MIMIEGVWKIRRFGLIRRRALTCIYGHKIKAVGEPFEIALPCLSVIIPAASTGWEQIANTDGGKSARSGLGTSARADLMRCDAQLYIVTMRARLLWAMDINGYETELIKHTGMEPDEIVEYFGAGFPVDMKIARL